MMRIWILVLSVILLGCSCLDFPYILSDPIPVKSVPPRKLSFHVDGSVISYESPLDEFRGFVGIGGGFGKDFVVGGYLRYGWIYWYDDCKSDWVLDKPIMIHLNLGYRWNSWSLGLDLFEGAGAGYSVYFGGSMNLGLGNPEYLTITLGFLQAGMKFHKYNFTLGIYLIPVGFNVGLRY